MIKVIKRDASLVDFDRSKIEKAVLKAMPYGDGTKPKIAEQISIEIEEELKDEEEVSIYEIENMVFNKLISKKQRNTAKSYEGYRSIREFQRENSNTIDQQIDELLGGISNYWNGENSNKNPRLSTTQRDYMAGIVSTDAVRRYLLPPEIVQAHDDGLIHFHDADYFVMRTHNCDLINLEDMLQNGTVISEVLIEKPHSFSTACTVTTQIIAQVASAQYGGQSFNLAHLAPFVEVSRKKIREEVEEELSEIYDYENYSGYHNMLDNLVETITEERLKKEIIKGIQTIQYQVVTLMTTNGQAPFITVFMYLNDAKNEQEKEDLAMLIEEMLNQRIQGVKNEKGIWVSPSFPKLIYCLEEDNIREDSKYWYLTKLAAECSAKRLVPDYISEKKMLEYKENNVYTCMGCVEGDEIVTYKFKNNLYVEGFKRMWNRISDYFEIKEQIPGNKKYVYIDTENSGELQIYDTNKGFVNVKKLIRNYSDKWLNVKMSNGRSLICTPDHPLPTKRGRVLAENLEYGDEIQINPNQYNEEKYLFDTDKAWLLGFVLCDGCYDNHVFSSIAITGEDDIQEKYIKAMKKCFNSETKIVEQHRGKKGEYKDLVSYGDDNLTGTIIDYFSSKFEGLTKLRRHIPNEVFSWDRKSKLSFLAGMVDADGYINPTSHNGSILQIGSTNKELALQQAALARALDMPAAVYQNKYTKKEPKKIRYRVEFTPSIELLEYMSCKKKINNFIHGDKNNYHYTTIVNEIIPKNISCYSYDVETESDHFEVSGIYSHNCRSFLTVDRFSENVGNISKAINFDEHKGHIYYGRFNQGVVTLNLVDVALSSSGDINKFFDILDERCELCHKTLRLRHERLLGTTSDVAPILWQYGALARLEKGETIDKLLYDGYSTISLGYAGLYECVKYMTGHSHSDEAEGEKFGLQVMEFMNNKCSDWKQKENIDYSIYGTPLESTTYKFAKKLKERFGIIEGITDRDYITNSYHIPVFEEIDPFEKLRIESKFQKLSPGGAISYIETGDMTNNIETNLEVIKYIYENIMYAELNTKSDYCQVCGYDKEIELLDIDGELKWKCPNCGNMDASKMNVVRRTCGYLGTASNGWNQGRLGDIHDRYVHLSDTELKEDK